MLRLFLLVLAFAAVPVAAQENALPRRAALGVQLADAPEGVLIQAVIPGGTAAALGVQVGDRLQRIDDQPIKTIPDVFGWVGRSRSGAPISLRVARGDSQLTLDGTAVARPMETNSSRYRVEYGAVRAAGGARLRTLISIPEGRDGPHPALMLIQGVTLSSIDTALIDANPYARLLAPFARAGYVTLRVDKPGQGDSEGGPGNKLDFNTELAGYRAALAALRKRPEVDPKRIFIIGHSMGGVWAPMLSSEQPVAGIAAFGTVFRTWNEYDLENARRQFRLSGMAPAEIHAAIAQRAMLNSALLMEQLAPRDAAKQRPALASIIADEIVDGVWNGRAVAFWQQLATVNLAEAWGKARAPVLAMHGSADFVAARSDHEMLAEAVRAAGQTGEFIEVAGVEHGFQAAASEAAAYAAMGKPGGTYQGQVARHIDRWLTPRTGLRAFDSLDRSLALLPAGTSAGRTMDASLGDVDGDGDLDMVLAKEFTSNVLLLQKAGRFELVEDAFSGRAEDSEEAVLGDFDSDGDLDAVFPSEDTALNEYWLNDGSGRFVAAPHALPSSTESNAGVAGDLDGDGDLDLVLSRNTKPELVLLNDGKGRFTDATKQWMPAVIDITQDLKLADLDADGDLDMVAGNESANGARNRLYRNLGNRFEDATAKMLPTAEPEETRKVAVGDIDGDGDLDLYFANVNFAAPDTALSRLLLNDGKGRFNNGSALLPAEHKGSVLDAVIGDLNADGKADLLLGTIGRGTRMLLNPGISSALVDRTPEGWASGEPASIGIAVLVLPNDLGVFESAFDRGDRVLSSNIRSEDLLQQALRSRLSR